MVDNWAPFGPESMYPQRYMDRSKTADGIQTGNGSQTGDRSQTGDGTRGKGNDDEEEGAAAGAHQHGQHEQGGQEHNDQQQGDQHGHHAVNETKKSSKQRVVPFYSIDGRQYVRTARFSTPPTLLNEVKRLTARACPVCDVKGMRPFNTAAQLLRHMDLKHEERLCDICVKVCVVGWVLCLCM